MFLLNVIIQNESLSKSFSYNIMSIIMPASVAKSFLRKFLLHSHWGFCTHILNSRTV